MFGGASFWSGMRFAGESTGGADNLPNNASFILFSIFFRRQDFRLVVLVVSADYFFVLTSPGINGMGHGGCRIGMLVGHGDSFVVYRCDCDELIDVSGGRGVWGVLTSRKGFTDSVMYFQAL